MRRKAPYTSTSRPTEASLHGQRINISIIIVHRPSSTDEPASKTSHFGTAAVKQDVQVLLATAVVSVKDSTGAFQDCRILLDGGSEASFITEECVTRLGLKTTHSDMVIKGIGGKTATRAHGQVQVTLMSRYQTHFIGSISTHLVKSHRDSTEHAVSSGPMGSLTRFGFGRPSVLKSKRN